MANDFFQQYDTSIIVGVNETPNSPFKLKRCIKFKLLMTLLLINKNIHNQN